MIRKFTIATAAMIAFALAQAAQAQHDTHGTAETSAKAVEQRVEHAADKGVTVDTHTAADAGHDAHAKEGLLDFHPDRLIWTLIIFLIMVVILSQTAWKQVLAGLKKREERIRADIREAEEARKRAEKTLGEYNAQLATAEQKVREMIGKAAADAERIVASIRTQAQQDAEETKERTARDIETAKNQAIQEIYAEAATLATSIAEKILRRNLNANDQRDLVAQSLEQLQTVGKR